MTQERIEELQKKLDKLKKKEQPPLQGGQLGQQFEEMGKSFQGIRENIPHIKIGSDKPGQQIPEDPFISKFRNWALIILTIVIAGTAGIVIVWKILSRFI